MSLALLAVEDQAGEEVGANADVLRVAVVTTVACTFTGRPFPSSAAVANGSADFVAAKDGAGVAVCGTGIAEAVEPPALGVKF